MSYCVYFRVSVSLISQLYQDNGYMYNPAIEAISWLEAFFKDEVQKTENHPKICKYVGKSGEITYELQNLALYCEKHT